MTVPDRAHKRVVLDFGKGTAIEGTDHWPGMRALFDGPVREAAVVFVNGNRAGSVWHPPYELDVTKYIRAGVNDIRLRVGNTAINEMAGEALPSYRLLNLRYGERFTPQDMENLKPLPSGIIGRVRLRWISNLALLIPEGNHGIYACGAPRRKVRRR